jgi:hypothetical protein
MVLGVHSPSGSARPGRVLWPPVLRRQSTDASATRSNPPEPAFVALPCWRACRAKWGARIREALIQERTMPSTTLTWTDEEGMRARRCAQLVPN